jgi:hypothetical protein
MLMSDPRHQPGILGCHWNKLFTTGNKFAVGAITLPGWEYLCLRRVLPGIRSRKFQEILEFQRYSRPGRV